MTSACVLPRFGGRSQDAHCAPTPALSITVGEARSNLPNEKVSSTMTLITKLLTNPLAQSRSTADAGDQPPGSWPSSTRADCRWHGNARPTT
jgi:hypothetical protein